MAGDISPISSKNKVPPSASSNKPFLLAVAPVNAPLMWPNSSLSSKFSGSAPQLIGMNAPSLRVEFWCSARATSSLPVPLSPCTKTVASVGATRAIMSKTAFICSDEATIWPGVKFWSFSTVERKRATSCLRCWRSLARPTASRQFFAIDGLGEIVDGTIFHRGDGGFNRAVTGEHDDFGLGIARFGGLKHVHARNAVEIEIGQDDVEIGLADFFHGIGARASLRDGMTGLLKQHGQSQAH